MPRGFEPMTLPASATPVPASKTLVFQGLRGFKTDTKEPLEEKTEEK